MLDRLVSGAGAITDAADRSVRLLTSGSGRAVARTRPGSLLVAAVLAVLAVLLVLAGLEATDPTTPIDLSPAVVATSSRLADRTYATISGSIDGGYSGTYGDENRNGVEDPGETDRSWYYWLVDPTRRTGIAVRSSRPPAEVFTFTGRGVVRSDVGYAFDDDSGLDAEAARTGLLIEKDTLIDTTSVTAAAAPFDLAGVLPSLGSPVAVSGSRLGSYLAVCTGDPDRNGRCDDDEQDRIEIVVFDPGARHGVRVLLRDWPEFSEATMTGLLRREERTAAFAKGLMGADFDGLDLRVSDRYVLNEPESPANAPAAFALAAVFAAIAVAIVVGLAGGYLVYRRADAPLPPATTTLGPGGALPLRITGIVRTPAGSEHVREVPGSLVRFVLGRAEPLPGPSTAGAPVAPHDDASAPEVSTAGAPAAEPADEAPPATQQGETTSWSVAATEAAPPGTDEAPPSTDVPPPDAAPVATTLVVERSGHPHGVELGAGELTGLSIGRVMPFRGPRPAIRVVAGTGVLVLSFDSEGERDRAAAELIEGAGLGPDGKPIPGDEGARWTPGN